MLHQAGCIQLGWLIAPVLEAAGWRLITQPYLAGEKGYGGFRNG